MFAGKSSALQSIVRRNKAIGLEVLVLKHAIDTRYLTMMENKEVISHDKQVCPALACSKLMTMLSLDVCKKAQLIIVEEGQFFEDLVEFALTIVEKEGKDLVVVGLDGDAHRKPLEPASCQAWRSIMPFARQVKSRGTHCSLKNRLAAS